MMHRIAVAMVALLVGVRAAWPGPEHAPLAFEPTVTREEAEWLRAAGEVAATNLQAAVAMIEPRRGARASAALDFAVGNFLFQSGADEDAVAAYREAIRKLPSFRAARVNLARIHLLRDRPQDALPLLRDVASDGIGDADSYLLLGHALLLTEAHVSAESAYRQALMLRPRDFDALLGLARALLPQQRNAEILALANELLQREPGRRELWALRADALLQADRAGDAAAALEGARRLGLADAEMLAALGDLHLDARRPEDAASAYREAFRGASPSIARLLRAAEGYAMLNQPDGAAELLERLEEVERVETIAHEWQVRAARLRADVARLRGDASTALRLYEDLLRLDPMDGRTMLRMAELHREEQRLEDAVILCERAARLRDHQVEAQVLQAQIEVEREDFARAVRLLETAYALDGDPRIGRYLEHVRNIHALTSAR